MTIDDHDYNINIIYEIQFIFLMLSIIFYQTYYNDARKRAAIILLFFIYKQIFLNVFKIKFNYNVHQSLAKLHTSLFFYIYKRIFLVVF